MRLGLMKSWVSNMRKYVQWVGSYGVESYFTVQFWELLKLFLKKCFLTQVRTFLTSYVIEWMLNERQTIIIKSSNKEPLRVCINLHKHIIYSRSTEFLNFAKRLPDIEKRMKNICYVQSTYQRYIMFCNTCYS